MLGAAVLIGFVALAIVCIALLGVPLGIVTWLAAFGLFGLLVRRLSRHIGDPDDAYEIERRAIRPQTRT